VSGSGARPAPRYRVVVYEHDAGREVEVMNATGAGFIAAVGTIRDGAMEGELGDGGPRALTEHIALLIASEYPA
jgi:hypothetical protein